MTWHGQIAREVKTASRTIELGIDEQFYMARHCSK